MPHHTDPGVFQLSENSPQGNEQHLPSLVGHFLASDMDGTLIFNHRISEKDLAAIDAYRRAGGMFGLCTGRSLNLTRDVVDQFGFDIDFAVMCSGGIVSDGSFTPQWASEIPHDVVQELLDFVQHWPTVAVCATFADTRDVVLMNSIGEGFATDLFDLFGPIGSVGDFRDHTVTVVPLWLPETKQRPRPAGFSIDECHALLEQRFGDRVDIHRNAEFLDIAPRGCTKATGLQGVVDGLATKPTITHTIGDNFNDLPMHAWSDHSASFPYSPQPVQQATSSVVGSVADFIAEIFAAATPGVRNSSSTAEETRR